MKYRTMKLTKEQIKKTDSAMIGRRTCKACKAKLIKGDKRFLALQPFSSLAAKFRGKMELAIFCEKCGGKVAKTFSDLYHSANEVGG